MSRNELQKRPELASIRGTLSWQMPGAVADYSLLGCSRAADKTAFVVPEMGWCVDAGDVVKNFRPREIFLTHTHSDHVHVLHRMKSRTTIPDIFAPAETVELLERYLLVTHELSIGRRIEDESVLDPAFKLVGVRPGDEHVISRGKRRFLVRVLATDHSVPSVGYAFYELKQKLIEELRGLPGAEIGRRKAAGEAVTREVREPMFAFLGDTTCEVFARHPEVLEMPVVVTECSFFGAEHLANAERTKHTHWDELRPIVADHPGTTFVLGHFSWRYDAGQVLSEFEAAGLENVVAWIEDESGLRYTMGL